MTKDTEVPVDRKASLFVAFPQTEEHASGLDHFRLGRRGVLVSVPHIS